MKVSRSVEYSYAVFGKYLKMIAYDSRYSKFFLGVPGILLLIGGLHQYLESLQIFAVLVSILGGAFLIRAFDIDRVWSSWSKPTPMGFYQNVYNGCRSIVDIIISASQVLHQLIQN